MGNFNSLIDLTTLDGIDGFRLDGKNAFDNSGWSVSAADDVNGDGFADILIGAQSASAGAKEKGETYVVFGGSQGF